MNCIIYTSFPLFPSFLAYHCLLYPSTSWCRRHRKKQNSSKRQWDQTRTTWAYNSSIIQVSTNISIHKFIKACPYSYFTLKASYFRSSEGKRATKRQLRTFHFQRTSKTRCSAYFAHNPTHEYGLASAWSDGRSNSLQPHPRATTCKDAGQSVLMRHQDAASTLCEQQTEGK